MTQRALPQACGRCGSAALVDHQVGGKTVTICASCGNGRDQLPRGSSRRRKDRRHVKRGR